MRAKKPEKIQPMFRLTKEAKKFWDHIVAVFPDGRLQPEDSPALTAMCVAWQHWRDILKEYQVNPDSWKDFCKMQAAQKNWVELARTFGMTPTDRRKLLAEGPKQKSKQEKNVIAELLRGNLN